jgi:hypothetical protein
MRHMRLPIAVVAALIAILARCSPLAGQWVVTAHVGADRFWGGPVETGDQLRSFRPYRPTTLGIGLERRGRTLGAGLSLGYSSAGLALEGADALVAAKGVFDVYSAAPELFYRITALGANELMVHGGPLFEVWKIIDEDSKARVGGHASVSLRVPLGGRVAGSLTAGVALIPSPFSSDLLSPGFENRALWRRRLAGGLEYRL